LNSMRLEKGYGIWSREFSRDYTPAMCGLDRFIDFEKPEFIGRAAAIRESKLLSQRKLLTFQVDATDADAAGYEPIWHNGEYAGFVTSGGFGHRTGTSIAMGYVNTDIAGKDEDFEISILGVRRPAQPVRLPLYDPSGERPRQ